MKKIYRRLPDTIFKNVGDDSVYVINLESQDAYVIDGLASEIWKALDGHHDLATILENLSKKKSCLIEEGLRKKTKTFLKKLEELNLIGEV